MSRRPAPRYPAVLLSQDGAVRKLLGVYDQRQEGLVLQRLRIPGGRLGATQLRAIAAAARAYDARDALHLTTRHGIEIHGLHAGDIPGLQARLAAAGLTTLGSAGDTLRGMTVDPEGGLVPGVFDLMPLALAVEAAAREIEGIWSLPRKFKISFSGGLTASMRPWASDLGVVAEPDGTMAAVVAGSLGARPATGIAYRSGLTADEIVALAVAAIRLHDLEGDRGRRSHARLRHVRERLGTAAFVERLDALFAEELATPRMPAPPAQPAVAADAAGEHVRLSVPHGDLPLHIAEELAELVEASRGELRVGIEHDLHLFGVAPADLPPEVAPWRLAGRIVACPGTTLCPKAVGDTARAADALAPLAAARPEQLFAISGCPNSCAHAAIADIGLVAGIARDGDTRTTVYKVLLDGEVARGPRLATPTAEKIALDDLADTVAELLEQ